MRLTHFGHACVRVQHGDGVLVIDPGTFSDAKAALHGATAVLVSHEHPDHVDVEALKAARASNPALTVHTHAALAAELGEGAVALAAGETFTAAGFTVKAVGGVHAEVIDGLPGCPNLGFIVDGLCHPGDSLFGAQADLAQTPSLTPRASAIATISAAPVTSSSITRNSASRRSRSAGARSNDLPAKTINNSTQERHTLGIRHRARLAWSDLQCQQM
ncbi:MBL fold metallo-hydrolase [Nonomuraea sp. NPDC049695]|uniref:MBL fold metallo-hydrolase n=1 Tax=Nonomuraea sp. NPDC049695 TaxID=3154734 RepID=UPI003442D10A